MATILPARHNDTNHNFRTLPEAAAILNAMHSLVPGSPTAVVVTMPDFLTMRSFLSYIRRYYQGIFKLKHLAQTPSSSLWTCKVFKRKEKAIREGYGVKKRRIFLAVIDSFARHGLVHYSSQCSPTPCPKCGHNSLEDIEQSITAGKAELRATQATQMDIATKEVDVYNEHAEQIAGAHRAATALDLTLRPAPRN